VEEIEIRRSTRRRRTIEARREGDRLIVMVPAGLSPEDERRAVDQLVAKLERRDAKRREGDVDLESRAATLSATYLQGRATPTSVRWVTNQHRRWGSCTPGTGEIRLSHHLQNMPPWVVDYVLLHELAHLIETDHTPRFWQLLSAYPQTQRARGFLEGVEFQR
jgi:hypothetical protein